MAERPAYLVEGRDCHVGHTEPWEEYEMDRETEEMEGQPQKQ